MSEEEETYGSLLFFRKTGEPGTSFPLVIGKTCIGSSVDADIRLKLKDERLEGIHCIVDVTENGIATIINKSRVAPICINTISVRTFKVLCNEDEIDLIGKKFQYLNDNISEEDIGKHQASLNQAIGTPLQTRKSVAPVVNIQSTKKTPNLKTKTSVQRKTISRKSFNRNHRESETPESTSDKSRILERPKTTSKLIVSKALGSPTGSKKRRLTFDDNLKKRDKNLKVSERNILLSEHIVSSTSDEQTAPSVSQVNVGNEVGDFLDMSNRSFSPSEDGFPEQTSTRRSSMRTPSRSSIRKKATEPAETPKSKINKTLSTPAKTETPKIMTPSCDRLNSTEIKAKTPKSTPLVNKRLELLKGTPNSTKKSTPLSKTGSAGKTMKKCDITDNFDVEPPLSSKKRANESISTPSSLKVTPHQISDTIKRRQKSFGSFPPPDKSMLTRRKTEGSRPTGKVLTQNTAENASERLLTLSRGRKSNIISVGSDLSEATEILNISDSSVSPIQPRTGLSSTDSDPFEEQMSKDPRLSLGKASPRKSVRSTRQADRYSRQSSGIKVADEEYSSRNLEQPVQDETLKNSELQRSIRRSNVLGKKEEQQSLNISQQCEEENLEGPDSAMSVSRTPAMRRSFRKSNLIGEASENESSSEESTVPNLPDESFSSSVSSKSENLDVFEQPANESRRSSRRSGPAKEEKESSMKEQSEISELKPIFVPQRRRPLRSYVDETKELSVRLSRTATPQSRRSQRHSSDSNTETKNEEDLSNRSTLGNTSKRVSRRRSTGKYCRSCEISPIKGPTPRHSSVRESTLSIFSESSYNEKDSISSTEESEKYTPKAKKSLSVNDSQSEEEISDVEYLNDSTNSKNRLSKNIRKPFSSSVITVDDESIKSTPENNTSIVILDTPLEKPRRTSHKKLSKTLNSSIEDCIELMTPKSAIKSRRSKTLPYEPIVEEITPVTPQEGSSGRESGFKTPLNTPGLFENIKNSVLKSRSRRRLSSNLMEELNKATKRPRESTESVDRSPKKRKMLADSSVGSTEDEDLDASFASFATDEIFANDDADQYVAPNTPHDFRNLTDKPLITDPQAKCLTEPRKRRSAPNRRSLHAMRLESQFSESDSTRSSSESEVTDSVTDANVASRRSRRLSLKAQKEEPQIKVETTPIHDLGSKKLLSTPTEAKSPKNDLTDVRGVRRLLQTPKPARSPKNDLSNIVGVKKLLSTPNIQNSPKNDLTQVPNLRKLVYPVQQNSPKNDLLNVAGVKKLLGTPKEVKTPKNDLRNVPNLRKIMSPKQQNSPRNDLSDVAGLKKLLSTPKKQKEPRNDLTNVAGVKKLMSTPKQPNSPLNDLTKVPNLRKIMSPKQQNSPKNDLSDVEGIADIFTETELYNSESDIENNEDLFGKLFVKKPIRTYRGKSLSPIARKAMLFGQDHRKTLGDAPVSSPRIEKWLEDQAVRLKKVDDAEKVNIKQLKEEKNSPKATPEAKNPVDTEETESQVEKKPRRRPKALHIETVENPVAESPRSLRNKQKNTVSESSVTDVIDSASETSKSPVPTKRGRVRKVSHREDAEETENPITKKLRGRSKAPHIETVQNLVVESPRSLRRRQKNTVTESPVTDINDSTHKTTKLKSPAPTKRGRVRKVSQREDTEETENQVENKSRERPKAFHIETVQNSVIESPRSLRRQKNTVTDPPMTDANDSTSKNSKLKASAPTKRGRARKLSQREDVEETENRVKNKSLEIPKAFHIETVQNPAVESPKSLRSRQKNLANESPITDNDVSTTSKLKSPAPPKRGRAKKVSQKEDMTQQVPEINSTTQDAKYEAETTDSEVATPAKRKGRQRTVSHDKGLDSIEQKPNTRRRKVQKKNEDTGSDTKVVQLPVRRGRSKKADNESNEEEGNVETENKKEPARNQKVKPSSQATKRNRKQIIIEDSDEDTKEEDDEEVIPDEVKESKKRNRMPNPTSEEISEPARKLRRRQIVIEDDDEISEENKENMQSNAPKRKVTKRRNQKSDPVLEEVDVQKENAEEEVAPSKTRSKKQPAKSQADKFTGATEDTPENSLRTRQRKGIFKKYGSEFVTDLKSVTFEENKVDDTKKCKEKAAEHTDAENPIRRSKRTRK